MNNVLFLLWIAGIGFGFTKLYIYSTTPGAVGINPKFWPARIALARSTIHPTLLVFLHPECPCSQATLAELEKMKLGITKPFDFVFIFYKPVQKKVAWVKGSLWKKAQLFTGARLLIDEDGSLAESFGAQTSGQTFLYDEIGTLVFSGGVTSSRGHLGPNAGVETISQFFRTGKGLAEKTPAFGCSIRKPQTNLVQAGP